MQLSYNDTDHKIQYFCQKIENDIRFEITQKSIDRVQKKLAANPHHPDLLFLAGKLAFNQHFLEEALHYFETAEACDTKVATHFGYYGWTLLKLKRLSEAEMKLAKGLEIDVNDFTTNLALGLLAYECENYEVALDHCNRGVYSGIHEFEFLRLKALSLLKLGKEISEILDIIKRAQKLGHDPALDYQYVRLLKIDGALEEARVFAKKQLEKNPTAYYDNAKLLLVVDYYDEALLEAQKVEQTAANKLKVAALIEKIEKRKAKQTMQLKPDPFEEIQRYIGLEDVKQKVQNLKNTITYHDASHLLELRMPHIIFQGEEGMKQRNIAHLLADVYRQSHILKSDHFIEFSTNINGGKLLSSLMAAVDGVIYIDAHSLLKGNDLMDRHANIKYIQTIITYTFSEYVHSPYQIILSANADQLDEIFKEIAQLRPHFRHTIYFEGYHFKHIEEHFHRLLRQKNYLLADDCKEMVTAKLKELYEQKSTHLNNISIQVAEDLCDVLFKELTKELADNDEKLITLTHFNQAYPSELIEEEIQSNSLYPFEELDSIVIEEIYSAEPLAKVFSFDELHHMIEQMKTLQSVKAFCYEIISNRQRHPHTAPLVYGKAIYIGKTAESAETLYTILRSQGAIHDNRFICMSFNDLLEQREVLLEQLANRQQTVLMIQEINHLHTVPNHTDIIQQLMASIVHEQFFMIFQGDIDSIEILLKNDTIKEMLTQQMELESQAVTIEDKLKRTVNQIREGQQLSQEAVNYTINYFSLHMKNFENIEKLIEALSSIPRETKMIGFLQRKQKEISARQMQASLEKKRSLK